MIILSYKKYIKSPNINGKYEIIQQGNDPVIGYADGSPCEDYEDTVIFGDHTLSLYKPNSPFFVATDGVRILKNNSLKSGYFLFSLLERYKPNNEGYKRYYSILSVNDCYISVDSEENRKIGAFFNSLDSLITLHQRELEKLKNIKKACLEKMFV